MSKNPFAHHLKTMPETLPIFPLGGVLLLPFGELPLNIFEPRYVKMIDDALASPARMIGMIQPDQRNAHHGIYTVGCAGKIVDFAETPDGRYVITLQGISRFKVHEELTVTTPYRQIRPDWDVFEQDMNDMACLDMNRERLLSLLEDYFASQEINADWDRISKASDGRLITCLSMVCPFAPEEKQALLEAACCKSRAQTFMAMLEMAVHAAKSGQGCCNS